MAGIINKIKGRNHKGEQQPMSYSSFNPGSYGPGKPNVLDERGRPVYNPDSVVRVGVTGQPQFNSGMQNPALNSNTQNPNFNSGIQSAPINSGNPSFNSGVQNPAINSNSGIQNSSLNAQNPALNSNNGLQNSNSTGGLQQPNVTTHSLAPIVQEQIRNDRVIEVQPVIHRTVEQTVVHHIEKHIIDPAPPQPQSQKIVERPPIIEEHVQTRHIDEVQPIIHRERVVPVVETTEQHVTEHVEQPTTHTREVIVEKLQNIGQKLRIGRNNNQQQQGLQQDLSGQQGLQQTTLDKDLSGRQHYNSPLPIHNISQPTTNQGLNNNLGQSATNTAPVLSKQQQEQASLPRATVAP